MRNNYIGILFVEEVNLNSEVFIHLTTKLLKPKCEENYLAVYRGKENHSYYSECDMCLRQASSFSGYYLKTLLMLSVHYSEVNLSWKF